MVVIEGCDPRDMGAILYLYWQHVRLTHNALANAA